MRPVIIGLIVVFSIFVALFVSNRIVQKILPTMVGDSWERRYGYGLMVRLIGGLICAAIIGLLGFAYESFR